MSKKKSVRKAAAQALEMDAAVAEAAGRTRDAPPIRLLSFLSKVGDQPPLRVLSAGFIVAGLLRPDSRALRAGVRMLAAHELATAIKDGVKNRIDRTRPRRASRQDERKPRPGTDTDKEQTSFPSGHSAGSIAVARAFAREFPQHQAAALAAATAVGAAQVPRYAHYPSDVAAGLAVGAVAEFAVDRLFEAFGFDAAADQDIGADSIGERQEGGLTES